MGQKYLLFNLKELQAQTSAKCNVKKIKTYKPEYIHKNTTYGSAHKKLDSPHHKKVFAFK